MDDQQQCGEDIRPGEEASVENRGDAPLSVTVSTSAGTRVTLELAPGQAMNVAAGDATARVALPAGRVDDLLVVRPGQPS
ncbi:MAG TPA: hypothetical protein VF210_20225 [Pseudomonadales bacterium]